MPNTPLDPPDSPPAAPVIPEGLATKLGKFGAPLIFVLGALADTVGVSLDGTSEKTFWAGIAMLVVTMLGRYAQATALYRDAPAPGVTPLSEDDFEVDAFDGPEAPPSEEELRGNYEQPSPFEAPGDAAPLPEGAVGDKPGQE